MIVIPVFGHEFSRCSTLVTNITGVARTPRFLRRLIHTLRENLTKKGLEIIVERAEEWATHAGSFLRLGPLLEQARHQEPARRPMLANLMRRLTLPPLLAMVEAAAAAEEVLLTRGRTRMREHGF